MKSIQFRKRPSLVEEISYSPIPVPEVNHSSRSGWKNEAIQAYEEIFGLPLASAKNDLAIPFPKDSFKERTKYKLKTALLKNMFALLSLFTKERGTHQNGGVGAKGTIRFLNNEAARKLDFCKTENPLPISLRHSNASFEDDACAQLRAMAFQIHLPGGETEDLLLSTGAIIPFWSLSSLLNFAKYRNKVKNDNWDPQKEWLKNSPTAFIAGIEAVRLAPESYTKMSYYSGMPYGIKETNEFVKFRVIPSDMKMESGLLTSEEQRRVWIQNRLDNNDKPKQYLADEFKDKLNNSSPIQYVLEAQFRTLNTETDTSEFFNLSRYWDDIRYPWEPIASLSAEKTLDDKKTEGLHFWLGNIPKGLDFMETYSADDYNSIATGRINIYPRAQAWRKK